MELYGLECNLLRHCVWGGVGTVHCDHPLKSLRITVKSMLSFCNMERCQNEVRIPIREGSPIA